MENLITVLKNLTQIVGLLLFARVVYRNYKHNEEMSVFDATIIIILLN